MDTMNKINPLPDPGSKDMIFKILIVVAIIILFGIVLYVLFGPLPSQSNFVKKGSNTESKLDELYVVGTSTLNGNALAKNDLTVAGNETVGGTLTVHETDFIINNTKQGSVIPGTNQIEIRGNGYVNIKNLNGTNTTAEFNTGTQETNFNGSVTINNPNGSSGLILKNQATPANYYKFRDDSSNNLVIDSYTGSSSRSVLTIEESGNEMTLLNESTNPLLYVGQGKGQVYDSVYNQPPSVGMTPTFTTLTVTGTTTLNGVAILNEDTIMNKTLTFPIDDTYVVFTPKTTGTNAIKFAGEKTINSNVYMHQILGFSTTSEGNTAIHAPTKVNITNSFGNGGSSLFDVRPNFITGTKTDQFRNSYLEPFVNIANGYLRISLPQYGTTPATGVGGIAAGQIVNIFSYISSDVATKTSGLFPSGTPLGLWITGDPTGNGIYVQSRMSAYSGVSNAQWTCPKKGIWSIDFNSKKTSSNNSFVIGNITNGQVYGTDFVSTFAVIEFGQNIAITSVTGSGTAGSSPTLVFKLIMELN